MKALETNRQVLVWLCILPIDEATTPWKKRAYQICGLFVTIINWSAFAGDVGNIIKTISEDDLEGFLFVLFQIIAMVNALYMLVVAYIQREKLTTIFQQLSDIYQKRTETEASFQFLQRANDFSELLWKFFFIVVLGAFGVGHILGATISICVSWFIFKEFNAKYMLHTFQFALPWDKTTLPGYIGEICFDIVSGETFLISSSLTLMFVSICLYHQAFYKVFQYSANQLYNSKKSDDQERQLCDLIQFHISAKDVFKISSEFFSQIILIQLISAALMLSVVTLHLDKQLQHLDFSIVIILCGAFFGISNLFLYCFFGKLATESHQCMADSLYEGNWLNLSDKLQKYCILMIANIQRPLYYHGFGLVVLDLGTFTKFIKTVFSYYMLLKTMTTE